jgi:stage II sporulation protein D
VRLADERRGPLGLFAEDLVFESVSPDAFLQVNGRAYRGEIIVQPRATGGLNVINAVHIEAYLRGVVPAELGRGAGVPDAALQAQAIAARSYTLYYLGRHAAEGFDLVDGPADQVYEGVAIETPGADAALRVTRGVVATHAGRPIRANYSSTCGGRTAASGSAWPGEDFPYLRSVRDQARGEDLCAASPHYRWTEEWPAESFEKRLLANLCQELPAAQAAGPTKIKRLEIRDRTPSGRVGALAVHTDRGCFVVRGNRIRWVLQRADGQPLRSTILGKLERRSEGGHSRYVLHGSGYGHGVGLCQYGAMGLARRGASAGQILAHYYRGTTLTRWW